MPGRVSPEMLKAIEMVAHGATAYRAAKNTGLHVSSVTRSPLYRKLMAERPETPVEATPMQRARVMVVEGGKTAYEAAKLTGVAQSSISRAAWYRAHIKGGNNG
jgi:hypothetical protein